MQVWLQKIATEYNILDSVQKVAISADFSKLQTIKNKTKQTNKKKPKQKQTHTKIQKTKKNKKKKKQVDKTIFKRDLELQHHHFQKTIVHLSFSNLVSLQSLFRKVFYVQVLEDISLSPQRLSTSG